MVRVHALKILRRTSLNYDIVIVQTRSTKIHISYRNNPNIPDRNNCELDLVEFTIHSNSRNTHERTHLFTRCSNQSLEKVFVYNFSIKCFTLIIIFWLNTDSTAFSLHGEAFAAYSNSSSSSKLVNMDDWGKPDKYSSCAELRITFSRCCF